MLGSLLEDYRKKWLSGSSLGAIYYHGWWIWVETCVKPHWDDDPIQLSLLEAHIIHELQCFDLLCRRWTGLAHRFEANCFVVPIFVIIVFWLYCLYATHIFLYKDVCWLISCCIYCWKKFSVAYLLKAKNLTHDCWYRLVVYIIYSVLSLFKVAWCYSKNWQLILLFVKYFILGVEGLLLW